MTNKIILTIYCLIAILFVIKFISFKKDKAFTKKIQDIFVKDFDPAKALDELDNKIMKSGYIRANIYLLDKYFALIWLGQWENAKQTASKINLKKIGIERKYRFEYFSLLRKFFSEDFNDIDIAYHKFLNNSSYKYLGKKALGNDIFDILYMLYIEKDYIKVMEKLELIIRNSNIHIIYLGLFYYCYAISKLNLGEKLDALMYFVKAMIFGENTFVREKAENYIKKIQIDFPEDIFLNNKIDEIVNQAYEKRTEYLENIINRKSRGVRHEAHLI